MLQFDDWINDLDQKNHIELNLIARKIGEYYPSFLFLSTRNFEVIELKHQIQLCYAIISEQYLNKIKDYVTVLELEQFKGKSHTVLEKILKASKWKKNLIDAYIYLTLSTQDPVKILEYKFAFNVGIIGAYLALNNCPTYKISITPENMGVKDGCICHLNCSGNASTIPEYTKLMLNNWYNFAINSEN